MKKALRIIFSPIVFIVSMLAGIAIPIWVISFMLGIGAIFYQWIMNKEKDEGLWEFTFAFLTFPYMQSVNFIHAKKIYNL